MMNLSSLPSPPLFSSSLSFRVKGCLGSGHFGTVHKGMWHVPGGFVDVAVKTLKADASEDDEVKFLREAAIMGQFLHPNVVKMHGVVTVGKPVSGGGGGYVGKEGVSGEGVCKWEGGGCEWGGSV